MKVNSDQAVPESSEREGRNISENANKNGNYFPVIAQTLQSYNNVLDANLAMIRAVWDTAQQQQRTATAMLDAVAASLPGARAQAAESWRRGLIASCEVFGQGLDQARRLAEATLSAPWPLAAGREGPREGRPS